MRTEYGLGESLQNPHSVSDLLRGNSEANPNIVALPPFPGFTASFRNGTRFEIHRPRMGTMRCRREGVLGPGHVLIIPVPSCSTLGNGV